MVVQKLVKAVINEDCPPNVGFALDRAGSIRFLLPDDTQVSFDILPPAKIFPYAVKRVLLTTACQVYLVPTAEPPTE